MSSTVSAFTTRKLPSFKPTAKAFPSGEKAQHLPPTKESTRNSSQHDSIIKQTQWREGDICPCAFCIECDSVFNIPCEKNYSFVIWMYLPFKPKDNDQNVKRTTRTRTTTTKNPPNKTFSLSLRFIHSFLTTWLSGIFQKTPEVNGGKEWRINKTSTFGSKKREDIWEQEYWNSVSRNLFGYRALHTKLALETLLI